MIGNGPPIALKLIGPYTNTMSKVLSFLGSINAPSSGEQLAPGTHACEVVSVSEKKPNFSDADFTVDEDEGSQIGVAVRGTNPDGRKAGKMIYLNLVGYVVHADVKTNEQAAPFVQNLDGADYGKTKADWKKMSALEKFRTAFRPSKYNGHAVDKMSNKRINDTFFDENGRLLPIDQQGEKTRAAFEIATRQALQMGFEGPDPKEPARGVLQALMEYDPNTEKHYCLVKIESRNYQGVDSTRGTIIGKATAAMVEAQALARAEA